MHLFKPYLFIPIITLGYGFFGGINFIRRGEFVDFYNELYFMLFVFFMMLSYTILKMSTIHKATTKSISGPFNFGATTLLLDLIVIAGFVSVAIDWHLIGGIPLLGDSESRKGSEPLFRLIFIISMFFAYYKMILSYKTRNKLILGVFLVLAVLSGYRTSIFFILIVLFFNTTRTAYFKRNVKKILLIFLLLFFAANLIKLYRDVNRFGLEEYYEIMDNEELSRTYFLVSPIIHTVREGPQIFQQIRNNIGNNYGGGKYFLEHVSTVLPGEQRNYGKIYNNLISAATENTKTGTILSPFYIDFGVVGICFLGLLLGIFNFFLDLKGRNLLYAHTVYLFFISFEITWVHGGAPFSPTFLLALFTLVLLWPFLGFLQIKSPN
ncbi:oligosaccharide repeat unit polymerase family protein [Flagellimonas meishanensis]|uniref:oligosaccharide repeat unit polymerase family protein n=1 Tax=Flagellimonas meishanensis TaxID=2873264 RepID=UPI00223AD792|nr:oligosaccharide repeat unit polymerase family protein [[Muricauda] meishanensis]